MSNAGSPDVETRTVGARLIYFTSVFADFTTFPLGDFLYILRRLQRLQYYIFNYQSYEVLVYTVNYYSYVALLYTVNYHRMQYYYTLLTIIAIKCYYALFTITAMYSSSIISTYSMYYYYIHW